MKNKITVFTPTYNRSSLLPRLYHSLVDQMFDEFEWLIIDDGSIDNTEQTVEKFIQEHRIGIRYIKVENRGKQQAINLGAQKARGELFFIVDSDDALINNSLYTIWSMYQDVCHNPEIAGICGLKAYFNLDQVGGDQFFENLICSPQDLRYKHKIKGDMAEVVKTEILRQYPFPYFEGEKFCSEGLVWNRIGQKYKFYYFHQKIYLCDYLEEGLTRTIAQHYRSSPQCSMLYYRELITNNPTFKYLVRASINYWRYSYFFKGIRRETMKPMLWMYLFYPLGYLFGKIDLIKLAKKK